MGYGISRGGARYVCFTTRHHDGFSMFRTAQSPYNVVEATPFARDVVRELAEECHRQGLGVHFYYSLIDWWREDAPHGRTGRGTGRDPEKEDADAYFDFMKAQLTELLTQYGDVGAIWFDGIWDQDENPGFDWRLGELLRPHTPAPAGLSGEQPPPRPFRGERMRRPSSDLPGENTAGLSGQEVSRLPLETCQTMNGSWGYRITDRNYKSTDELIRYLAGAAGRGGNLLLNIGPQPDGALPDAALERLAGTIRSFSSLSFASLALASSRIRWISCSVRPDEASMRIFCSLPVPLSLADTFRCRWRRYRRSPRSAAHRAERPEYRPGGSGRSTCCRGPADARPGRR